MATITKTVDVDVPVRVAYDQWTQFETFPRFMEGVDEVRQIDDTHLHWVADVGGRTEEWDAEITRQEPDQRVAWSSISGTQNAGAVTFEALGAAATRVTLHMTWRPEGVVEDLGAVLGLDDRRVEGDLERFKSFIEKRGGATGAWRGSVEHADAVSSGARGTSRSTSGS